MRGAHSERKPARHEFGLVLGHGHVHMNGRAFICACGCGTHVYSTRTGPGHGLRTPYRTGCTARVNAGACLLHFACVRAVRCSAWIVRAVVYLECVCVCVRQSACVARLVFFVHSVSYVNAGKCA